MLQNGIRHVREAIIAAGKLVSFVFALAYLAFTVALAWFSRCDYACKHNCSRICPCLLLGLVRHAGFRITSDFDL